MEEIDSEQKQLDIYGRCDECNLIMTDFNWCHPCNAKFFKENFNSWTSGNNNIDTFIQETQLSAKNHFNVLEWIDFDKFSEIKYIAEGGYGTVYRAKWKDGYIFIRDNKNKSWGRLQPKMLVALKSLNNSKDVTLEFINEV